MAKRVPNPITYAGPPTHGTWDNNDVVVDVNGIVWICNASGSPGSWTEGSTGGGSGGGVTTVSVASANGFAGTVANPTTTPAITIETSVTGLLKGNGTGVSGATAGTDYLTPSGSGASLTGITASQVGALPSTDDLSAIASANATAGNVAMNSHKITGLSNGTASTDAAAFGQIPTALPPNGSASGDLSGSYPSPTVAKINGSPLGTMGTPSSNQGLLWNGTAWVPTTITQSMVTNAQQGPLTGDVTTSGAAATLVGTTNVEGIIRANSLDQMTAPAAAVSFNSQRLTNLAAPQATTDAAQALGCLLGATYYEPATAANKTTSSASLVAVDTTNLTVSFTAISTAVVVELVSPVGFFTNSAQNYVMWALFTHSTTTQVGYTVTALSSSGTTLSPNGFAKIRVTGLTAGTSYQWDWAYAVTGGATALMSIHAVTGAASGDTGPAIMQVFAA